VTLRRPPLWLIEEAWLERLLRYTVRRLERNEGNRAVILQINAQKLPDLFRFDEDTGYRWELIEELAREYALWDIRLARTGPSDERYLGAKLRVNPAAEPLLRYWLDIPRVDPERAAWNDAIAEFSDAFADAGRGLQDNPIRIDGMSPRQIVSGFARIGGYLGKAMSARQISARCFQGYSKVLDQRQDLLERLHGPAAQAIVPRPLLLNAWAPSGFERVLLVENQDSFIGLCEAQLPGYALLYSAGFRASAERLITPHTRFAFLPGSDAAAFCARWQAEPMFFWGDLDYAGMGILRALRRSLPHLLAWEPGYRPLLEALQTGHGHEPGTASKAAQKDPVETGCTFSDTHLLPTLRATGRFIDQEWVHPYPHLPA
jgi:hypothetical protein